MADDVKQEFSDFEVGDEPDDDEVAALAGDDSEVARLDDDDSTEAPDEVDGTDSGPVPEPDTDGHSEHPVAGAIKAEREKSSPPEGA